MTKLALIIKVEKNNGKSSIGTGFSPFNQNEILAKTYKNIQNKGLRYK
ncbi:hypothetical protein KCF3NO3_29550 [Chryseobacterium sp. KCF3-3]